MNNFPFLRLPDEAKKEVFKNIKLLELITFSLLSKRTKTIAEAQNRRVTLANVSVSQYICLNVQDDNYDKMNLRFYHRGEQDNDVDRFNEDEHEQVEGYEGPVALTKPKFVKSVKYIDFWTKQEFILTKPEFEFHDWINHILTVLHCPPKIDGLFFNCNYTRFDIKSIFEALQKSKPVYDLHMSNIGRITREVARQVLDIFHCTRSLRLLVNPFEDKISIRKLLMRNYTAIDIHNIITLDDLLSINSSDIELNGDYSEIFFNRFLKLWSCGSNPRMRHLLNQGRKTNLNAEDILKGIHYTEISGKQARVFKRPAGLWRNAWDLVLTGGYDITRFDGTVATLIVRKWTVGGCTIELIKYSTCSKSSKTSTKSLKLKVFEFYASIDTKFDLVFNFENRIRIVIKFSPILTANWNRPDPFNFTHPNAVDLIEIPANQWPNVVGLPHTLENTRLSINDWIHHVMDIFECDPQLQHISIRTAGYRFGSRMLMAAFKNIRCDSLRFKDPHMEYCCNLVSKVFPQASKYQFYLPNLVHQESMRKVLTQNASFIEFQLAPDLNFQFSLNDLLALNTSSFHMIHSKITCKDLNRFLKLWSKGSNSRMDFMKLTFDRRIERNEILSGIKSRLMGPEEQRQKRYKWELPGVQTVHVRGAYVITRMTDGVEATVTFRVLRNSSSLTFIVWFS
ncbi:unnamed protein product [Caenorhabditis brenneri]